MVRPYFHPDRALKVRSKQKRLTTVTFQATIMGQNRLSVGQRGVFLGESEGVNEKIGFEV